MKCPAGCSGDYTAEELTNHINNEHQKQDYVIQEEKNNLPEIKQHYNLATTKQMTPVVIKLQVIDFAVYTELIKKIQAVVEDNKNKVEMDSVLFNPEIK